MASKNKDIQRSAYEISLKNVLWMDLSEKGRKLFSKKRGASKRKKVNNIIICRKLWKKHASTDFIQRQKSLVQIFP